MSVDEEPPDLGGYDNPPVVEVVAAVRFADLPVAITSSYGEFARTRMASLPIIEVQAPYGAPVEQFGTAVPPQGITFTLGGPPLAQRLWYTDDQHEELVQLQSNWMACNWRKVGPDSTYQRWGPRRAAFIGRYRALEAWVGELGGSLQPNQCEVTYINHIASSSLWTRHGEIDRVLRVIDPGAVAPGVTFEGAAYEGRYLFGPESDPSGRLYVSIQPAFAKKADSPIFVVDLTARGAPTSSDLDSVVAFMDEGRRAIVTMFEAITTVEAQRGWGKR